MNFKKFPYYKKILYFKKDSFGNIQIKYLILFKPKKIIIKLNII